MSEIMMIMVAALGAEVLLVLFVLLAVSWYRNRSARQRDGKAIRALVGRIAQVKPAREQAITQFLSTRMGLAGDQLANTATGMLRAELVLLQRFAGIYARRDAGAAAQFDIDVVAAIEPYQLLQGGLVDTKGDTPEVDPAELEALRAENARLSDELRVTMETMSRMLNEYSAMFGGGTGEGGAPIASLIGGAATPDGADQAADQSPDEPPPVVSAPDAPVVAETLPDEGDDVGEDDIELSLADAPDEPANLGGVEPGQPVSGDPGLAQDPVADEDTPEPAAGTASSVGGAGDIGGDSLFEDGQAADDAVADVDALFDEITRAGAEQGPGEELATRPVHTDPGAAAVGTGAVGLEDIEETDVEAAVVIEPGDDLESVSILLEDGPAEVVGQDGAEDDADVDLAEIDDDLFDSVGVETVVRADAALDDRPVDDAGEAVDDDHDETGQLRKRVGS